MKPYVGKQSGFTLVELVVVIGILAILSSVSIVGYNQFITNARTSRARTELTIVQRLVEAQYYADSYDYLEVGSEATVSYEPLTDTFTVTYDGEAGNESEIGDAIAAAINAAQDNDDLAVYSENDPSAEGFTHTDDDPKLYVHVTEDGDDYNLVMVYFTGSGGSLEWTGLQIEVEGT